MVYPWLYKVAGADQSPSGKLPRGKTDTGTYLLVAKRPV